MNVTREILYNKIKHIPARKVVVYYDGNNIDLQKTILKTIDKSIDQVKLIAPLFRGANDFETVKNIWQYCRDQQTYVRDSYQQNIKFPSAFIRTGTGDCKTYATFIAACLYCLNIPQSVEFTNYTGAELPSHVYNRFLYNGTWYPIDGTYFKFATELPYKKKLRYNMRINNITGLDQESNDVVYILGYNDNINGDGLKKIAQKFKDATQKLLDAGKTVVLAPARVAFLGLVKINVHKIATNLKTALQKDAGGKIYALWKKFGGDPNQLYNVVKEGALKKPILDNVGADNESINAVTLAAALAAAVPVLVALLPLLKSLNPGAAKDADNLENAAGDGLDKTGIDPTQEPDTSKEPGKADPYGGANNTQKTSSGKNSNTGLYVLGTAALLYAFSRK